MYRLYTCTGLQWNNNKSSSGDEIPERDVTYHLLSLLIYHWITTHLQVYFQNIFLSKPNCYISNGRRFTKSALRMLLLSTFRVSSINYFLASSFPIHARSSANAEGPRAHCQLKSCKCCTNVRRIAFEKACNQWMTSKVIQGHSRCCHFIGHIQFPISRPL